MPGRILRSLIGWSARLAGLLVALVLLLSAALLFYTTTDDFRGRLLAYAVPELDRRMAGDLSVGGLSGSPLRRLRVEDVRLAWHGEEIVRLPAVSIEIDWSALFRRRLEIPVIELESPRIVFREHRSEGFDWREALAPLVPAPDDPRPPRPEPPPVVIERLAITSGVLRIEAQDRPALEQTGIDLAGRIDFEAKQITLEQAAITSGGSKLSGRGGIPFHGRWQLDLAVESLHPRDLTHLVPDLARRLDFMAPATGHLMVSGEQKQIDVEGNLDWPEARLSFDAHGDPSPFDRRQAKLAARFESRELARFFPDSPVSGRLDAELALDAGEGTLRAALRPTTGGELVADGRFSLADRPEAALRFEATRLDPARFLRAHPEWQGALTGRGTLALAGERRETLTAQLALALDASRLGRLEIRRGRLDATLAGETIELTQLSLESAAGKASVRGKLGTNPEAPVALDGRVDLRDLAPFLALAGRRGSGALRGTLEAEGTLAKARLASDLTLTGFALEDFRIERAHLVLRTRGAFADGIDARLEQLRLESELGVWQLARPARLRASRDAIEWTDARFESGESTLAFDGRIGRSGRQSLTIVARALPIASWASAHPELVRPGLLTRSRLDFELAVAGTASAPTFDLHLAPRDLVVSERAIERIDATLRYDARTLEASLEAATEPALHLTARARLPFALRWQTGFLAEPTGPLEAHAECDASDLAFLEPFLDGQIEGLGGAAHCRIALAGPVDALEPSGELTLRGLRGRPRRTGVTVVEGELAIELAADRFRVRRASATAAGFEDSARFRAEGEGPLPEFLTRWSGPVKHRESATTAAAEDSKAAAGAANAAETANDYTTTIELERWPLVATSRDRLIASGHLTARGRFEAPRVEGRVEIVEGTLRPNLAFLSGGPPPRDPTIELELEPDPSAGTGTDAAGSKRNGEASAGPNARALYDALELAVDIDVGRDLWIKHESAEVLLAGRVAARKQSGKALSLEGRIEAQRGFADLQRRRFRLIEGSLELVGGAKIDPVLDVLGRHKARAHVIDARLTGTASKPVLTLSSDPTLSQEDILAVLLFGRPSSELSQEQQSSLSQRAVGLASSMGLTAVGRSVASALGLDALGLQIDELSNQRASVGAYLGRNIFVALAQDFSGERGQELSIEYEFWPGWSVVGSTTSQGTNSADLVWKIRY
ncbi:MAG: translocation/assembly module TamB domain-containing protein [Deltaproteobacteria bacterium]|nr:translocation/assembly module TamB domain-containing protein [Deltaproteobacteria bacterium]